MCGRSRARPAPSDAAKDGQQLRRQRRIRGPLRVGSELDERPRHGTERRSRIRRRARRRWSSCLRSGCGRDHRRERGASVVAQRNVLPRVCRRPALGIAATTTRGAGAPCNIIAHRFGRYRRLLARCTRESRWSGSSCSSSLGWCRAAVAGSTDRLAPTSSSRRIPQSCASSGEQIDAVSHNPPSSYQPVAGVPLNSGTKHHRMEDARSESKAIALESCWNKEGSRLASSASIARRAKSRWLLLDYTAGVRDGWTYGENDCLLALQSQRVEKSWKPSAPGSARP